MALSATTAIQGSQDDNVMFDIYMNQAVSGLEKSVLRIIKERGLNSQ